MMVFTDRVTKSILFGAAHVDIYTEAKNSKFMSDLETSVKSPSLIHSARHESGALMFKCQVIE